MNSLYLFILWLQTVEVDGELHQGGRLHPPGRQLDKQVVVEDDRADGREPRRKIAVGAAQLVVAEVEVLQPWQSENCDRHTREVVAGHVQRHQVRQAFQSNVHVQEAIFSSLIEVTG